MIYRGYEIEETDFTTTVQVGSREEVRPVFIIPGLKERPSSPFLTTPQEARDYIDAELDAREEWRESRTWRWEATIRRKGNSLSISVPAKAVRILGLEEGDEVSVALERRRAGRRHFGPPGAGRRSGARREERGAR